MSSPRAISELTMRPLYQYTDQEPPITIRVGKAAEIYKRLLRRGVIVRPVGGGYGLPEHLRVTIGTAQEDERFLNALAASLKE